MPDELNGELNDSDDPTNIDLEALLVEVQSALFGRGGGLRPFLTREDVEDAVQDANLELLQMIRLQQVHTNLKGLAHLAVRRKGLRQIKRQQRQREILQAYAFNQAVVEADSAAPDAGILQEEKADRVWQAFLTLGDLERLTVGLRYYEGYSYQTIAEVLGFDDADAVNTCLRRARRLMRRFLLKGKATGQAGSQPGNQTRNEPENEIGGER